MKIEQNIVGLNTQGLPNGAVAAGDPFIRLYQPSDRDQIAEICIRTADSGLDARGIYSDDTLMPEVFAFPYLEYEPDLALVVDDGSGERAVGYLVGVADTRSFVDWWARDWAPGFYQRHPRVGEPTKFTPSFSEAALLHVAMNPQFMLTSELEKYPAHLHIDLLPEVQGKGFGRRLIDTFLLMLATWKVLGVHLQVGSNNRNALAFYTRLGFQELAASNSDVKLLGLSKGKTLSRSKHPRTS